MLTRDPWGALQRFTEARIALGRCGLSLPLEESLRFKLAHAKAWDAVHQPVQMELVAKQSKSTGFKTFQLASSITNRAEYLTRPDKGRCLGTESINILKTQQKGYDLGIIICDGLSAPAVHQSATKVTWGFLDIIKTTHLSALSQMAELLLVRKSEFYSG